jgi:multifunctional 2-oxoglutarate metabolism enzyme
MTTTASPASFGPNDWLVDEMYEQYLADPASVSESWREFFADYRRGGAKGDAPAATPPPAPAPAPAAPPADTAPAPAPAATPAPAPAAPPSPAAAKPEAEPEAPAPAGDPVELLRGPAARIAANMSASTAVPTATSVRVVPAKLLEVNRRILNRHLARGSGGKVSFTHLIGYAMVKAVRAMPVMNSSFKEVDGKPAVVRHRHLGLGIAVDVEKSDGSRTLMVPNVRDADTLDFRDFWLAYEELIRKVRNNRVGADDLAGVSATLTNPGTIGTVHSVPRLMPGQGVIVGVGAIDYPAEYQAADPHLLAKLGVSKVITLTSTYDHRVIQGAESGMFLQHMHQYLLGDEGFYDEVFAAMGVPYEPVRWRRDINPIDSEMADREKQVHVQTLINMYRVRGHLIADLDPLRWKEPKTHPELDPATYGLTIWDLDREFFTDGVAGRRTMTLGDLLGVLRDAYCRTIGVEYMHIQEPDQKRWIQDQVEGSQVMAEPAEQRHILERLNAAEAFEQFLNRKYTGHKRFGIDGAESAIPLIDAILGSAADAGLDESVIGMAHRGRLNVLANIVGKSVGEIFREFDGEIDPNTTQGSGDVKYHKGAQGKFVSRNGSELPITLASNPSHLEAVDPVVEGMARAKQDLIDRPGSFSVLPLLMHGDAAFAGQGVVAETLNLSALRGYQTGGTIHLVINNQVGFTTAPEAARSSVYATDVAKMVQAPIFHVNGDDPEACVRVARLAFDFRQAFHKDVVIDMMCYRRFGHNEGDEPSYTQPKMYRRIENRRSVRKLYTEALVNRGDITLEDAEAALQDFQSRLQSAFDETRQSAMTGVRARPAPEPIGVLPHVDTGIDRSTYDTIIEALHTLPEGFHIHPKLARQFEARSKVIESGEVDWAVGEALAFGSLLMEGTDVRLTGQDTRRGTFSQRHSVLVDYETEEEWTPLQHLGEGQGKLWIYDSLLSEYAALGFEYGYSVAHKDALVGWEAQFGDFINGAQIIIDQFLVAAEDKWGQTSGVVLLLPHGYEGQGPEHSSARVERFLTLSAEDNIQVVYPTTAASYFHVLRRQLHRDIRKPLVIFTPKSLLRAKEARSPVDAFVRGSFEEVLDDPGVGDRDAVRRLVLCSGKIAYEAIRARDQQGVGAVAVVRFEQLYPWPGERLNELLESYPNVSEVVWLQEEPANMGCWPFVHERLHRLPRDRYTVRHVSRPESGAPACGSLTVHQQEQEDIVGKVLAGFS